MKTLLSLLLIFCHTFKTTPVLGAVPASEKSVTRTVVESIVRITGNIPDGREGYVCTGFSIAPRKFLTAAHCVHSLEIEISETQAVETHLEVDGISAIAAKIDEINDLAIVLADEIKPSLVIREETLTVLEQVDALGYGEGYPFPTFTHHLVLALNFIIDESIAPGTIFQNPFIGGMSGGPVYDSVGQVVGIVQRSGSFTGYGVDSATILHFLAP